MLWNMRDIAFKEFMYTYIYIYEKYREICEVDKHYQKKKRD